MTGAHPPSAWQSVTDPAAVRALTDPASRRYLEPFIGQERSVGAAADELGEAINPVLMRVRRFGRLGLLRVVRAESRAGRAIKHHRAPDGFLFLTATPTTPAPKPG